MPASLMVDYRARGFVEEDACLSGFTPPWNDEEKRRRIFNKLSTRGMTRVAIYLSEYSQRSLGYDADALNAVRGALNTLIAENVYHIWGVPFCFDNHKDPLKECPRGEIALVWRLQNFGSRR